jgi:hypothetical protein
MAPLPAELSATLSLLFENSTHICFLTPIIGEDAIRPVGNEVDGPHRPAESPAKVAILLFRPPGEKG